MALEILRDKWEHMEVRERKLLSLLGATGVFCVFAFIAMTIGDGLDAIDQANQERRDALDNLQVLRIQKASVVKGPKVKIGKEAPSLSTYLEGIATEVGVSVPNYQPQPTQPQGKYEKISMNMDLREVTLLELAEFMEKVETNNKTVVITNLKIEKSRRDQEKLRKASMTVSTYRKAPSGSGEGGGSGDGG